MIAPKGPALSDLPSANITRFSPSPQASLSSAEGERPHPPRSIDEQLFDNAAELKVAVASVIMHLSLEWRDVIFQQLDELLSRENWQDDSAFINKTTFMNFLRFIIYARPTRLPSLGVGPTEHILAAWGTPDCQVSVEFLFDDRAAATFVHKGGRAREAVAWRGHVADLRNFLLRNDMISALQE
ncbi:MAG TPA: hypothetical protein VN715_16460 [Roseiarcus sp.]|nr:hypothetical protein [Roseiarcus sp.]